MPKTIKLDHLPAGFTLDNARDGEQISVSCRNFISSEDGDQLIDCLEQISENWLAKLPEPPHESTIDHLVIVFRRDATAEIFINEVPMRAFITLKGDGAVGAPVARDSVADVHRMVLEGVDIPPDAGFLALFSCGWRKGVVYDFTAIPGDAPRSSDELERLLASAWTYLLFQDRVRLTEDDWSRMIGAQWFPFIGLPSARVRELKQHLRAGWSADDLLPEMIQDVTSSLPRLRRMVDRTWLLDGHRKVIGAGLDHFEKGDYLSTSLVLYPRIEGVLRKQHANANLGTKTDQQHLPKSAVADVGGVRHQWSLLMPSRFQSYLETVYFASFDPKAPSGANRNTVGHGVAPEAELGPKAAVLAILIVEQLAYMCHRAESSAEPAAGSGAAPP